VGEVWGPPFLATAKIAPAACQLPRLHGLHDHDSTTRENLGGGGGARGPGPARAGLLRLQSMQHEGAVPGNCVQNEMRRASHL
jgi:hypothetical protein